MSKLVDLTGQRFGRLTVIAKEGSREYRPGKYRIYWRCKCDCGNECSAHTTDLRAGKVKSCGCLRKEILDTIGERNRSQNRFCINGNIVHVFFNNKPGEMLVDLDVWSAWASTYCWHLNANGYAATRYNGKNTIFHDIAFQNRPKSQLWVAQIQIGGKYKYLGRYADMNEAIKARIEAEEKYFGDYRRKE